MRRDEKDEVKKAMDDLGGNLGQEHSKDFQQLSQQALAQQMVPRKIMGVSDAMMEGLYSQAYRLYNTGKYKDASQLFRLLITMDSTASKYAMGLAACMHMMKEYTNAVSMYTLCGIIDPESPIPYYHASDCYLQMKDKISAMISLEMAVKRAEGKPEFQALKDRALLTIASLKNELVPEVKVAEKETI